MARTKLKESRERLLRQSTGDYGDGSSARGKYQAPAPDAAMYGVFQPAYATSLGRETGSTAADILNQTALRMEASDEQQRYGEALRRAQELQEKLQANDAYYGFLGDVGERNVDYTKLGMGGAETVVIGPDGRPTISRDPVLQSVGNTEALNTNQAERFGDIATGVKTLGEAGYVQTPEDIGRRVTSAWQTEPDKYMPGLIPQAETERFRVEHRLDEGLTAEQQLEIERTKAAAKDKGVQGKWVWDPTTQRYTWQLSGDIEDMQSVPGAPPIPNPNAGARGGSVPATPAATPTATSFFSEDRITSRVGPRRAPMKGASTNHRGTDYAYPAGTPIPAIADGEVIESGQISGYGNRIKVRYSDGRVESYSHNQPNMLPVGTKFRAGQALARVGSSGTATGPHVHREVHSGPTQRMATAREVPQGAATNPRTNARVLLNRAKSRGLEATMNDDGSVTVQTPQGPRTYGPDGKLRNG